MSQQTSSQYKLIYFPFKGGAETIRLMFAYAGIEYEDCRIKPEDWPAMKESMPQKSIPVLEIDGVKYCQSAALVRYLARQHDLYGKEPLDSLTIDEVGETIVDMSKPVSDIFNEKDDSKKQELMKKLIEDGKAKYVPFLEKRFAERAGKFLLGNDLSIGDLVVYRFMEFLKDYAAQMKLPDYDWTWGSAALQKHYKDVEDIPSLKKWIESRPKSEV